jgi:protein tyrosine phosphatase
MKILKNIISQRMLIKELNIKIDLKNINKQKIKNINIKNKTSHMSKLIEHLQVINWIHIIQKHNILLLS